MLITPEMVISSKEDGDQPEYSTSSKIIQRLRMDTSSKEYAVGQEMAACIQSDETRMSTNDDK